MTPDRCVLRPDGAGGRSDGRTQEENVSRGVLVKYAAVRRHLDHTAALERNTVALIRLTAALESLSVLAERPVSDH